TVMSLRMVGCFFQAEDGIRVDLVTGVQTCALPILPRSLRPWFSIYFLIAASFSPTVETKYPTLQMLPSRYISRMNLNRFFSIARSEERRVGKECKLRGSS